MGILGRDNYSVILLLCCLWTGVVLLFSCKSFIFSFSVCMGCVCACIVCVWDVCMNVLCMLVQYACTTADVWTRRTTLEVGPHFPPCLRQGFLFSAVWAKLALSLWTLMSVSPISLKSGTSDGYTAASLVWALGLEPGSFCLCYGATISLSLAGVLSVRCCHISVDTVVKDTRMQLKKFRKWQLSP